MNSARMQTPVSPPQESLADIRREIDRIDDGILELIANRLDVVERVRAYKAGTGSLGTSPIRPGREAQILRRLIDRAGDRVPADLCFRIWRALIATASLKQAAIRIHGSAGSSLPLRRRHFCGNISALPRWPSMRARRRP